MFTSVSSRSASAYKRVGVETSVDNADPHKLVALLFDALHTALGGARFAMQNGDIAAKCKHISHAVRIFEEGLIAPLNLQEGGDIAANLHDLYTYCVQRLTMANIRNDASIIEEVQRVIEPVSSGWKQINGKGPAYLQPV
ncbi:flagellar export chaperone FliS [Rhodoferax sp. OV413]|uniref:flagellar export chaperone FliS n=1 Tax=Rhodoferax sp. OV413 TaxID=1855285 RepID=UPI0025F59C5A|nr:flagellar export chaperone FliS [Rhodoferax sp. OV413]